MTTQAPTADIDICNLACDHCKEAPITGIDPAKSEKEKLFARWYDTVRRQLLRMQPWQFAKKYKMLPRTGDGEGQWADAYRLPVDFIRLNHVGETLDDEWEYEMSEGRILANGGNSLPIHYNRDISDVRLFDAMFVNYFALHLALKVAFKLTGKKAVVDQISQLIALEEPKTTSVNGQERKPRRVERSKYTGLRRGLGSHPTRGGGKYWNWADN